MKITGLKVQSKDKNRCNLYIDGDFKCGISVEATYKYGLKIGAEITNDMLNEVIFSSQKSQALTKAINYVSKSLKTKKQVKDYLLGKDFNIDIVYFVIDKLKEYGYIDDVEYSRKYIELNSKNKGERLIDYNLMQKGVKKEDIYLARESAVVDNFSSILTIVEKRLKNKEITRELLSKTYKYLIGKGFSYDDIDKVISKYKEEF